MSQQENKKEPLIHFVYKTDEDIRKVNEERGKNVSENKKSEYTFNGEDLYFVGMGHSFGMGYFNEYITKSGIVARMFHYSQKWGIGNDSYEYVDAEFVLIPPTPVSDTPIDWESIKFPTVKNMTGPIADKIIPAQPKEKP